MADFFSRVGSSSQPETPNKIYVGTVKKVRAADNKLRVRVPQLGQDTDYIPAIASGTVNHYQEGDKVLCAFIDGRLNELFVLGRYSYRPNSEVDIGDDLSLGGDLVVTGNISTTIGDITSGRDLFVTGSLAVDVDTLYVNSSTDRVGIGTNSPDSTLQVNGITKTGDLTVVSTGLDDPTIIIDPNDGLGVIRRGSGYMDIYAINDAETGYDTIYLNGPNAVFTGTSVGIGTTSPAYNLHVPGTVYLGDSTIGGFVNTDTDEWPKLEWLRDTSGAINWDEGLIKGSSSRGVFGLAHFGIHFHQDRSFAFHTSGWDTEMEIKGDGTLYMKGPVGIGLSTPAYTLDVSGTGRFTGNLTTSGILYYGNSAIVASDGGSSNIDHIWHDDTGNAWNFCSDTTYRARGNSSIVTAHHYPNATNAYDLGSSTYRWRNIYTQDLHLSNGIGDYTIIEGEENLYLTNNKTGKSFKFALIEVDSAEVPAKSEVA